MSTKLEMKTDSRKAVKCPTKRGVNLAKRESNSRGAATLVCGIVLIAALSACVAKFAVIDQLERERQAEAAYNAVHAQYVQMQDALSEYPQVEQEYRTYSRSWMQDDGTGLFVSVDRMEVLDLLENQLMPNGQVNTLTVQRDTIIVTMSGMNLEQISAMFAKLQELPIVSSASLNIASTAKDAPAEELDFSITITLQPEEADA